MRLCRLAAAGTLAGGARLVDVAVDEGEPGARVVPGDGIGGSAAIYRPTGLCLDPEDEATLYVTAEDHRVRTIVTYASALQGDAGDGGPSPVLRGALRAALGKPPEWGEAMASKTAPPAVAETAMIRRQASMASQSGGAGEVAIEMLAEKRTSATSVNDLGGNGESKSRTRHT